MRTAEDVKTKLKIIVVGNINVGKTQLINQWRDNSCLSSIGPTNDFDFFHVNIENAQLTLWDSPGSPGTDKRASLVSAYIRGSQIVCIVISATDTKKDKITQINQWIEVINKQITPGYNPVIVILENKMDLTNTSALTINDREGIEGQYALYKAVSAKQGINLTQILDPLLRQIIQNELFKKINNYEDDDEILLVNKEIQQFNPNNRVDYDLTKQRISGLTEQESYLILQSLINILFNGPLNKKDKPYDIKFSGGKPLTIDDGTGITVPKHVHSWIEKIRLTHQFSNQNKILLAKLYDEIDQASATKPFSRSSSTHDFYYHSLTGFITHATKKDPLNPNLSYLSLINTINTFSEEIINTILKELFDTLENGVSSNSKDNPYNVGFWGGRKHISSITKQKIKVPEHVGALFEYLASTADTPKAKLIRALDSVLVASYSTNSSRDVTTQNFYTNLARDLMCRINELHIHPQARSTNLLSRVN